MAGNHLRNRVLDDIGKLFMDADDYDVQLVIGEEPNAKTYNAHSVILRARSSYFNAALSSQWREREGNTLVFSKPNILPAVFEVLLCYLYTGTVSMEATKKQGVSAILAAADEIQLEALVDHLQEELINQHDAYINRHLVELYETTAALASCRKLHQYCADIISERPHSILDLTNIDHDTLQLLLKNNKLDIDEVDLWEKVVAWGVAHTAGLRAGTHCWTSSDFARLKETLAELIPLVRFVSIGPTDFWHRVVPYKKAMPKDLYKEVLQFHLDSEYDPESGRLLPGRQRVPRVDSVLMNSKHVGWLLKHIDTRLSKTESSHAVDERYTFTLLYRASQHGFNPSDFHRQCDGRGATITVARVADTQELLGGYTPISWSCATENSWKKSNDSFIFALGDKRLEGAIVSHVSNADGALWHHDNYGPWFGNWDFGLGNGAAFNSGECYAEHSYYARDIKKSPGSFSVDEVEVFSVVKLE